MPFLKVRAGRVSSLLFALALFVPVAASAQTLKVLDWNTHHGVGTDGKYDLQRFVTWIVRSGAHVVSLNEVEKFTGWGNEDQPARYAALLRAATGRTWYYKFAQRDGGTNGQGNLILSTIPFEATGSRTLSYSRSVARAQIVVNGVRVNVFSTHLDADSSSRRATQMDELRSWVSGYPQQHIMAGDFNAWPGATEISHMTAFAYDAWAEAKSDGTAVAYEGNSAGNTRNSRIDYIWYSKKATQLVLKNAQVFDTRNSSGVMPSDHRPVMATFQVGSGSSGGGGSATTTTTATTTTATTTASAPIEVTGDFDGDLKSDLSVYRPGTSEWFVVRSGGAGVMQLAWGAVGDVPVAGDYDADGRQDIAVFRPGNGVWYVRPSSTGTTVALQWGTAGDITVAGDYDGDGRTDVAVFRPATGHWFVRHANTGAGTVVQWGTAGDIPVPGDYNGDGRTDFAVFRPVGGIWYVRYSVGGTTSFQWGGFGDIPVAGDYDGDGRTDGAVFRPSNGTWYARYSRTGASAAWLWGAATDRPAPGDYDGDGRTDVAVFRPSTGIWYLLYSSNGGTAALQWGAGGDIPLPGR